MGSAPPFTVRIASRDGVATIVLSGELDRMSVPVLNEHLTHLEHQGVAVIVLVASMNSFNWAA